MRRLIATAVVVTCSGAAAACGGPPALDVGQGGESTLCTSASHPGDWTVASHTADASTDLEIEELELVGADGVRLEESSLSTLDGPTTIPGTSPGWPGELVDVDGPIWRDRRQAEGETMAKGESRVLVLRVVVEEVPATLEGIRVRYRSGWRGRAADTSTRIEWRETCGP
ncbi:hypothetical protein [Janibacter melonis]|uniref:hypothetical protein n=1 Tax=Janibacter melonis TaxID=262209 RepID=UPI002094BA1F|nr:hypothetical protein [Janibacter melonis]